MTENTFWDTLSEHFCRYFWRLLLMVCYTFVFSIVVRKSADDGAFLFQNLESDQQLQPDLRILSFRPDISRIRFS